MTLTVTGWSKTVVWLKNLLFFRSIKCTLATTGRFGAYVISFKFLFKIRQLWTYRSTQSWVSLSLWIRLSIANKKLLYVLTFTVFTLSLSEYVKVFDGNGTEVVSIDRRNLSLTHFQEISFGSSENVTIQASLIYSLSYINIDYGIMNQAFDSGE